MKLQPETDAQLLTRIWITLERTTEKLSKVPERQQRFAWQNIANLRGAFRKGPNGKPAPIESFTHERLFGTIWELSTIEGQIDLWIRNNQVSAWEESVKANPPKRVILTATKEQL